MRSYDTILVGLGLAGGCLAWAHQARGSELMMIDREEAVTASRIAAGLVTPVTGQRLVKTWRLDEFYPCARDFYRWIELETGAAFFHELPAVRLFVDDNERACYEKRQSSPSYAGMFAPMDRWPASMPASFGGVELVPAARLDVAQFLNVTREHLKSRQCYRVGELRLPQDVQFIHHGVELPAWGVRARHLIFCQGYAAHANPWFQGFAWNPAKGEILIVAIPGHEEPRIVHRGIWIAPTGTQNASGDRLYRVGATYDWNRLDQVPTPHGREELERRLAISLTVPFHVVGHDAAIRPILKNLNPVIGCLPEHPAIGFMNGLGSKGSLMAPYFSQQLAGHLIEGTPLEPAVDFSIRRGQGG